MHFKLLFLAIAATIFVSAKALPELDDTTAALLGIDDFEDADVEDGDPAARGLRGPGAPISFIPNQALPVGRGPRHRGKHHKHGKHGKHHRKHMKAHHKHGKHRHRKNKQHHVAILPRHKKHHKSNEDVPSFPNGLPILP